MINVIGSSFLPDQVSTMLFFFFFGIVGIVSRVFWLSYIFSIVPCFPSFICYNVSMNY